MIPDKSVDLIILDPPYYKIKGKFDFIWKTMDDYISWCTQWVKECERVLSSRGSLYLYGVELQLEIMATEISKITSLEYRNRITLHKPQSYIKDLYGSQEHFRRFIPSAEFLLFYTFKDETGWSKANISSKYVDLIAEIQLDVFNSGISQEDVINLFLSEGRYTSEASARVHASYKIGWNKGKRFDLMDEKMYRHLSKEINWSKTYDHFKSKYLDIKNLLDDEVKKYESERYTFNAKDGMTNVWDFEPDRGKSKTKHPTQKPAAICDRIINISSNAGDVVLIPFAGSGSECVSAAKLKRDFIGFELEPEYIEIANQRLESLT